MKNLKAIREEHGAGEWGTPELTNKYKSETPGQDIDESIKRKQDLMRVTHGAMSQAEFNAKWHKPKEKNTLAGPGGLNKNLVKKEDTQTENLKDACWKGYEAIGMKMKNGRKVPNCVPKEDTTTIEKPVEEGHAEDAQAAHQAAHAALKKGDIDTYHKEMDKKFAAHVAASGEAAKKPAKTYEQASLEEDKNLKIIKHEKAAVEASKRGDRYAQQWHLAKVKALKAGFGSEKNESVVAEAKEEPKMQKHLVTVTVTDPHHSMASKRKEKIMKRVKVSAEDPKAAVKKAEAHYKKHGFKVHDSLHHSIVNESLDTDEFVDSYDPQNASDGISMAKGQLNQIGSMAGDLHGIVHLHGAAKKELEPWVQGKITTALDQLDDVHSYLKYGEKEYDDASDANKNPNKEAVAEETEKDEEGLSDEDKAAIGRIKTLIRLGLLENSQLQIAVRVLRKLDMNQPIVASQERAVLAELLEKLVGIVTGDDAIFRKVRLSVQQQ